LAGRAFIPFAPFLQLRHTLHGLLCLLAARFFGELILGENTPLDFAFSNPGFVITLVVTLLFGYFASRVPANNATKITVREAIAYE